MGSSCLKTIVVSMSVVVMSGYRMAAGSKQFHGLIDRAWHSKEALLVYGIPPSKEQGKSLHTHMP